MEHAPVESRGRIFWVLLLLGNLAAIAPLAFLGAIADLYGVANVVGFVSIATLFITYVAIREGTREHQAPTPPESRGKSNASAS